MEHIVTVLLAAYGLHKAIETLVGRYVTRESFVYRTAYRFATWQAGRNKKGNQ